MYHSSTEMGESTKSLRLTHDFWCCTVLKSVAIRSVNSLLSALTNSVCSWCRRTCESRFFNRERLSFFSYTTKPPQTFSDSSKQHLQVRQIKERRFQPSAAKGFSPLAAPTNTQALLPLRRTLRNQRGAASSCPVPVGSRGAAAPPGGLQRYDRGGWERWDTRSSPQPPRKPPPVGLPKFFPSY